MIKESRGKISDELYALGAPALPAYLLKGGTPVLFDSGMTFMGPTYLKELREHLGEAGRLSHLLLTHSHFDHSGAAPYLKRNIPGLKVGAGKAAAETFRKASAIQLIQNLSKAMEDAHGDRIGGEDVIFRGLEVDILLEDGDAIELSGTRIRVIATPGHTRDAVSYYLPGLKALVCGESVGSFNRDLTVRSVFLSSYRDYLMSLEKLKNLEIAFMLLGHGRYLTGEDAAGMVEKAIAATRELKERVEAELRDSGGDQEAVVQKIFDEDYVQRRMSDQDERPFLINLRAQVKAIAEGK
ncbi:MAG TPA: MBL fold metallo-hydrolase [Thermodesulfobacteriota bacterium]|nr:MBL fold metallo-hydrolase [Thermodesulfobacteriota bacterium]